MPIVVAVLGIIIVVLGAAFFLIPDPKSTPKEESPMVVTEDVTRTEEMEAKEELTVETETKTTVDTSLEAKTYTENVTYLTPARTEHKMAVTLKVANGIVTEADVVYDGKAGFSNPSQERFDGAFAGEVIGKPLAEISLSRVGGASLSSAAFNEAVAKIVAQQS
jgi:hypothetical protein